MTTNPSITITGTIDYPEIPKEIKVYLKNPVDRSSIYSFSVPIEYLTVEEITDIANNYRKELFVKIGQIDPIKKFLDDTAIITYENGTHPEFKDGYWEAHTDAVKVITKNLGI